MGQAYPELVRAEPLIAETLKLEETRFRKTLERGLAILDEKSGAPQEGRHVRRRDRVHALRHLWLSARPHPGRAAPRGIGVDLDAFTDAMEKQREKARASWAGSGEAATETIWFPLREKLGATEFLGYETETRRRRGHGAGEGRQGSRRAQAGETGIVVLNQTPFYGESGGQVGDTGVLTGEGVRFRVTDTQKRAGDLFAHVGTVEQGTLKSGAALALDVDHVRRSAIRANHSATHLLHEALRQVLGDHVAQKGSLVAPDRLRFDFAHPKPMSAEELRAVEDIANDVVLQNARSRRG